MQYRRLGEAATWHAAPWALAFVCLCLLCAPSPARAAGALAGRTIVLNPEEGGSSSGGIVGSVEEKDLNLATTLDVGALLTQAGARVVYTRSSDVTVSLKARSALANQAGADAFITIAANTLGDPSFSGSITFYGPSGGYADGHTRSADLVAESRNLARDIQAGVVQATGEVDRGVQSADFYVLGYSEMPAILIETGFMTNPPELQKLITPSYQQTIAQGIVSGLTQFFGAQPGATFRPDATPAPLPAALVPNERYAGDVTYPDHSVVSPGQSLTKTWAVTNSGAVAWNDTFSLTLQPGASVQSAQSVALPAVAPGETVDLSASVTAPSAPGTYTGSWRLTTPDGHPFGTPLWIVVSVPVPLFTSYWVEATRATPLYSGPADPSATFGTLAQWSPLLVLAPQDGPRLFVRNPATGGAAYVAAAAVGPSGPPATGQRGQKSGSSDATADTTPYLIKPGDTLSSIATAFGVRVLAIAQANGIADPSAIVAGRTLQIPDGATVFRPFWVENFARTSLWSGVDRRALELGVAAQFTPMEVLAPAQTNRYLVRVWATGGIAYVDANVVGPAGAPGGAQQ